MVTNTTNWTLHYINNDCCLTAELEAKIHVHVMCSCGWEFVVVDVIDLFQYVLRILTCMVLDYYLYWTKWLVPM